MRVSIWSHDSNPAIDPRLYKQSLPRCEYGVNAGFLRWIDPNDRSKGCLTTPVRACLDLNDEHLVSAAHEACASASITESEVKANVGIAETAGAVIRAQHKIKAWMHPSTSDRHSPLPRGSWINANSVQIVVVQ